VIVVLVGDENAGEIFGLEAKPCESPHGLRDVETAIDENARGFAFDDETVTFAAAAE
jgi:hypothetical protein